MQDKNESAKKNYRTVFIVLLLLLFISAIVALMLILGKKKQDLETDTQSETSASRTGTEDTAATEAVTEEKGGDTRVSQTIIDNMAPATSVDGVTVTDEMLEKGILNEGNKARLMSLMERAAKGEEITIAYIGGSITAGSNASPMATACYAALSTDWWKATFPDAKINYVNAGIGATDSYIGAHRVARDVLPYAPDLVIVEYSVNDSRSLNQETYDSLLRTLLTSESQPAVISLMIAHKYGSFADKHAPVAFKYQVPMISYSALLTMGYVPWDKVGNADGTHPDNPGHQLIAHLLTSYYRRVLSRINTAEPEEYTVPDLKKSQTECRYMNADILFSDNFTPDKLEGFSAGPVTKILFNDNGWKTTDGGSMTFTVEAREIGIIWLQKSVDPQGTYASYEVLIDGESKGILTGVADSWGAHLEYITELLGDEAAKHTVELRPAAENTGCEFEILGIAVSR